MIDAVALALGLVAPELEWIAPPGCPDRAAIELRLRERLPGDAIAPRARFVVSQRGRRWRIEVTLGDGSEASVRVLEGASCDEVAQAAVVLTGIAATTLAPAEPLPIVEASEATPLASTTAAAPAELPLPPPTIRAAPSPAATTEPAVARRHAPRRPRAAIRRPMFLVQLAPGVGLALTSPAAALLALELGLAGRRWSVTLGATHTFVRRVDVRGRADARVSLTSFDARGCGEPGVGRWQFPLCGGISVGAANGEGVDLPVTDARRSPWVALRAGAGARVWLHRNLGLWARAEPVFVVGRPSLVVVGVGTACCSAPVGFQAAIGVVARFGSRAATTIDRPGHPPGT